MATVSATSAIAKPAVASATVTSSQLAEPRTIDMPESKGDSRIVSIRNDPYNGEPICVIEVSYKGAVVQSVYRSGESCEHVTARFLDLKQIATLGSGRPLPEEARDDARRSGGKVLYVEGSASSSIYPLNSAGRLYEVPVAD